MKICFVLEHFYPHVGGAEVAFSEFLKYLAKKGHELRVVTSHSGGIIGQRDFFGADIFYYKSLSMFGHPLLPKREICGHIKWADLIHTTTYTAAPTALSLSKKWQKPCVITVLEAIGKKWFLVEKNTFKAAIFRIFEWFVVTKKYDAWHVISQSTHDDLLNFNIHQNKIAPIHLGMNDTQWNPDVSKNDLHAYFGFNNDEKIFLFSGRPGKTKGIFVLFDAIKSISQKVTPGFKFGFILSDDPLHEKIKLKKLIVENHLQEIIKIKDSVPYDDLPGYKKDCFACIIPSLTEGFGLSAIETAYLGVPMILSDAGSLPEVGSGKVLFFQNNNPAALADKIMQAMENKFDFISPKLFIWKDSADKLEKLYQKLILK